MTSRSRIHIVLIAAALLLASCASQPPGPTYAEIAAQYPAIDYPERITVDLDTDCPDDMCSVSAVNIERLMTIIMRLNDEVEKRIDAYNHLQHALAHCEYANTKKDQAIQLLEQKSDKLEFISMAKQLITGAACAALLITQ